MLEFIHCPACSAQLEYTPDLIGLRIACTRCKYVFAVAAPSRRDVPISLPAPPAKPIESNQNDEESDYIPFAPEDPDEPMEVDLDWTAESGGYASPAVMA